MDSFEPKKAKLSASSSEGTAAQEGQEQGDEAFAACADSSAGPSTEPEVNHIMNRLFDMELDLVLQFLFSELDPRTLTACKLVCRQWYNFIKQRVWASPIVRVYETSSNVFDLQFDDDIIVAGHHGSGADVLDRRTGERRYRLEADPTVEEITVVQVALGRDVIVTVTSSGHVMIWDRETGQLVQGLDHHAGKSVWGVKLAGDYLLTCGEDKSLAILRYEHSARRAQMLAQLREHTYSVSHVDSDGVRAVTGSEKELKVWSLSELKLKLTINVSRAHSLALQHPLVATIGYSGAPGVCLFNVEDGSLVRHFARGSHFMDVKIDGRHLVLASYPRGEFYYCKSEILVYDMAQLADSRVPESGFWSREFATLQEEDQFGLAVANSCLMYSAEHRLVKALDFWDCLEYTNVGWTMDTFLDGIQLCPSRDSAFDGGLPFDSLMSFMGVQLGSDIDDDTSESDYDFDDEFFSDASAPFSSDSSESLDSDDSEAY